MHGIKKLKKSTERSEKSHGNNKGSYRIVLVVVDFPQLVTRALFYACRFAVAHGFRIALLHVRPRVDSNPLMFLGKLAGQRSRAFAEEYVQEVSDKVKGWGCPLPSFYMREGDVVEEIQKLLSEPDHHISLLVLSDQKFQGIASALSRVFAVRQASFWGRFGGKPSKKSDNKAGTRQAVFRPFIVIPEELSLDEIERMV